MVVFSNGEKLHPNNMEATTPLERNERLTDTEEGRKAILEELSPFIIKANRSIPTFAKISQGRVSFAIAGKPMLRTDKGTVKRHATDQAYEEEIDQFHADIAGFEGPVDAI